MKKLSLILGILILIKCVFHAFLNYGQTVSYKIWPHMAPINMNLALLIALLTISGVLAGFLITNYFLMSLKEKIKKQTRNVEKAYIETQESSDKVKSLQAKIDTLEAALKEALK